MFKVDNNGADVNDIFCDSVFIVNFEHISHLFLVFLLLTFSIWLCAGSSITRWIYELN